MSFSKGPKFVDAHVHLRGREGMDFLSRSGIAAARDAGMKPEGSDRRCCRQERVIVVTSCWALYKTGGYGGLFGVPISTMKDAKEEIGKLKKAGADIIKVMASGMVSLSNPGAITAGGFDKDELTFIAREASAAGLCVMAHANGEHAISAAAEAGVRSIEHGFFMTEQKLEMLAEKQIYWTPTAGALMRAAEKAGTSDARDYASRLVRRHLTMIKSAYALGVPLAIGTDCVLPDPRYRAAYEAELRSFEAAGIPPAEVKRIATENGARLLGIGESVRK